MELSDFGILCEKRRREFELMPSFAAIREAVVSSKEKPGHEIADVLKSLGVTPPHAP
jgi:hypothetical protein